MARLEQDDCEEARGYANVIYLNTAMYVIALTTESQKKMTHENEKKKKPTDKKFKGNWKNRIYFPLWLTPHQNSQLM